MGKILAALAICAASLQADSWPAAQRTEIFSEDGKRFVRITPGESYGDTIGFAGAEKGKYAHAELFERAPDRSFRLAADFDLVNPVAPVDALLSNSGRLITFDNWHNAGYGKVVAIYSAEGELVKAYELEELYSAEALTDVQASVSSRWWRCKPQGWSDPTEQTLVYVHEQRGGYWVFSMSDGAKRYDAGESPCSE